MTAQEARSSPGWIVDPGFDLSFVFGGALLSLLALGLTVGAGVSMVAVFWIWLLGFDGPHMAATYARTYLDRGEWRDRRGLLLASLGVFAIGPACLALAAAFHAAWLFSAFLGVAATYGYYHVVRQHYGFLSLYKLRHGERSGFDLQLDKWSLYVGCWAPYLLFLVSHPRARALMGLASEVSPRSALSVLLLVLCALAPLVFAANALRRPAAERNRPKLAYGLLTLLVHDLIYLLASRYEPVYAASAGPDTDFLLLSVMVTIFHNVQYVALVWNHGRRRHAASDSAAHGAAAWLSRTPLRYLVVCLSFSGIYFALAASTGVYPRFSLFERRLLLGVSWNQIGLSLWWGLALHHYVLDQKIWRLRSDERLRRDLGFAGELSARAS